MTTEAACPVLRDRLDLSAEAIARRGTVNTEMDSGSRTMHRNACATPSETALRTTPALPSVQHSAAPVWRFAFPVVQLWWLQKRVFYVEEATPFVYDGNDNCESRGNLNETRREYRRFRQLLKINKFFRIFVISIMMLVVTAGNGDHADAHAVLEKTTPAANSQMGTSPAIVEILYSVNDLIPGEPSCSVLNNSSRVVTDGEPISIEQGKGLRLALPKLGEGHYTVSYSVISADGHPVSGAFIFTVGHPDPQPNGSQQDPHLQIEHSHDSGGFSSQDFLLYASRVLYYAGLVMVTGLILWSLHRNASINTS